MEILPARTDEEIRACFPVIRQLRPHLTEPEFMARVRRQMENHGYRLVFIREGANVKAAAGYRVAEFLAWGKALYVDDLITDEGSRNRGYGGALMDFLHEEARKADCAEFHLDSGVHRFDAHRLYLNKRMIISSHHFSKMVE